jgi:nitrate/nitrite transporter NarK
LNDDGDRWRDPEPPLRGPSAPPDLRFNPLATAIGVFAAIAIPAVVVAYTRQHQGTIIAIGVVLGLLCGVLAGLWVASRDGRVWRGPQL